MSACRREKSAQNAPLPNSEKQTCPPAKNVNWVTWQTSKEMAVCLENLATYAQQTSTSLMPNAALAFRTRRDARLA
tara:strand:- start:729 stop:956 length:228 start_codon:yes stop_codon:yes gene_type:complete